LKWDELIYYHNGQEQIVTAGRKAHVVEDILA
jgi:hypothetical protein